MTALEYLLKVFVRYTSRVRREAIIATTGAMSILIIVVTSIVATVKQIFNLSQKVTDLEHETEELRLKDELKQEWSTDYSKPKSDSSYGKPNSTDRRTQT